MASLLDRLIGRLDPERGLRRHRARQMLERAYEGASTKDGWRPKRNGASPNTDHRADASMLRARSRSLMQNVPYVAQGSRAKVSQVIGTGIKPRSTAKNEATAKRLNQLWLEMVDYFDADGRVDVYGFQGLAFKAMDCDGEVLIRIRYRRPGDGLAAPIQFQLLEIDWLDSSRNETRGGNQVINGIEYDVLGKVYGYWLFDQHPGETNGFFRRRASSHFVPAASIIHLFNPDRPGQGRGFPSLAPVIARVRDLQLYEDAELARKNQEARLGVLASGDVSLMANGVAELASPADPATVKQTGDLGVLPSGGITQLPDGVHLEVIEPKPAGGYVEYVRQNLQVIAAGYGVTYEMMTGDVSQANFSSARVRMLDFRREAEMMRWLTLIPKLIAPMWRAFVEACYLADLISERDYTVQFATPKWEYVDPDKDVKADISEISAGLSSISEKLRSRGYEPAEVFAEIASDFETLKSHNVLDILMFLQRGSAPDTAAQSDQGKANARMLEAVGQVLDRMDTRLASLEQRSTNVSVTTGDSTVNVPPTQTNVDVRNEAPVIHVPAPNVEVRNEAPVINVPAAERPVVNVTAHATAPVVNVENRVPPAQVSVTMPARQSTSAIDYDSQGRIKTVVRTEGDIGEQTVTNGGG